MPLVWLPIAMTALYRGVVVEGVLGAAPLVNPLPAAAAAAVFAIGWFFW